MEQHWLISNRGIKKLNYCTILNAIKTFVEPSCNTYRNYNAKCMILTPDTNNSNSMFT